MHNVNFIHHLNTETIPNSHIPCQRQQARACSGERSSLLGDSKLPRGKMLLVRQVVQALKLQQIVRKATAGLGMTRARAKEQRIFQAATLSQYSIILTLCIDVLDRTSYL